jgi:cell wall-associated NlpC family hydrolase
MKRKTRILCATLAFLTALPLYACSENSTLPPSNELESVTPDQTLPPETNGTDENNGSNTQTPPVTTPTPAPNPEPPKPQTAKYIRCTGDNVNLRSGAGTSFTAIGQAEKNTMYAVIGQTGNWYKVNYQNKTAYLYSEYAAVFTLEKSNDEKVEKVIEEGYKLLGVPYVYGAIRLHDGKGKFLKGFSVNKFDCSSLVQYAFYKGAGVLLDVTTRTQVVQGKFVKKSELKRGDCIYFTNETRQYKTGVERIGHVAIYLGNDYILHTASDYARIEKMSATRHKFYIETRRFL